MQFTTVRSKEKDYDIYLKSEKLVHSQQEHEKNVSQLFGSEKTGSQLFQAGQTLLQLLGERKKWIPAIWSPKNVVHNCQEQGKRLLHLFKVRKTGSQTVGARKIFPQLFGSGKNWFLAISSLTNTVASIQREKKVDSCYFETKKFNSQLLGSRKKFMTSI